MGKRSFSRRNRPRPVPRDALAYDALHLVMGGARMAFRPLHRRLVVDTMLHLGTLVDAANHQSPGVGRVVLRAGGAVKKIDPKNHPFQSSSAPSRVDTARPKLFRHCSYSCHFSPPFLFSMLSPWSSRNTILFARWNDFSATPPAPSRDTWLSQKTQTPHCPPATWRSCPTDGAYTPVIPKVPVPRLFRFCDCVQCFFGWLWTMTP